MVYRAMWETLKAPSRIMRLASAAGVAALLVAAGLAFTPSARADEGDNGTLLYYCGNGTFGYCSVIVTDTLSVSSTQTLDTLLDSVPGPQRPVVLQGIQSLGPYGAESLLHFYSYQSPEAIQQQMSFLSNMLQNWSPDYQRALTIQYFQNQ